jgi:hypothetical protein
MGVLDALLFGYRYVFDAVNAEVPQRNRIKFTCEVTDDPATKTTIVDVASAVAQAVADASIVIKEMTIEDAGTLHDVVTLFDDDGTMRAVSMLDFTDAANVNVTGLMNDETILEGDPPRQIFIFASNATGSVTLKHENVGSLPENRIVCPGATDFVVAYGDTIALIYSRVQLRWRVIAQA